MFNLYFSFFIIIIMIFGTKFVNYYYKFYHMLKYLDIDQKFNYFKINTIVNLISYNEKIKNFIIYYVLIPIIKLNYISISLFTSLLNSLCEKDVDNFFNKINESEIIKINPITNLNSNVILNIDNMVKTMIPNTIKIIKNNEPISDTLFIYNDVVAETNNKIYLLNDKSDLINDQSIILNDETNLPNDEIDLLNNGTNLINEQCVTNINLLNLSDTKYKLFQEKNIVTNNYINNNIMNQFPDNDNLNDYLVNTDTKVINLLSNNINTDVFDTNNYLSNIKTINSELKDTDDNFKNIADLIKLSNNKSEETNIIETINIDDIDFGDIENSSITSNPTPINTKSNIIKIGKKKLS